MGFLIVFLRNAKRGQFDDLDTPAMRILFDEKPKTQTEIKTEEQPKWTRKLFTTTTKL